MAGADGDEEKHITTNSVDQNIDTGDHGTCGYGDCHPRGLQKAANVKALLAVLCYFVFVQGFLVNGINNVNTATLERRFNLNSARVAWISSSYDISAAICCVILGYVATFVHKGRILTVTAAILCLGSFVMMLPHLFVGNYELGQATSEECDAYGNLTRCDGSDSSDDSLYLYVFILGMVLIGAGGSSVYIVGSTWMDDNLEPHNTPLFLGIQHGFATLGPAVAFVGGGALLDIYVDVNKLDPDQITISPTDPRWVGAWWIGFVVAGIAMVPLIFLLACFPKTLPESVKRSKHGSQAYRGAGDKKMSSSHYGHSCQDIIYSLKVTFSNPPWIFSTIAGIMMSGAVMAFNTFLPKMLQFQFGLTASFAAIISGAVVVPGAAFGQILGGIISRRLRLKVRGLFVMAGICSVIAGVLGPILLLRCDLVDIAGVTTHYSNSSMPDGAAAPDLVNACNSHCNCTRRSYEPVCSGSTQYFSPCHAACTHRHQDADGKEVYTDCTCVVDDVHSSTPSATTATSWDAVSGICDADCNKLAIFMPVFLVIVIAIFVSNTVGHSVVIRCVPDKNKAFAYGLQSALVRLLGNVPGPIVLGIIFDDSCLVWQDNCGSRGSCWIYDSAALSWRLFWVLFTANTVSLLMFFLSAGIYKPPQDITIEMHVQSEDIATGDEDDTKCQKDIPNGSMAFHIRDNADIKHTEPSGNNEAAVTLKNEDGISYPVKQQPSSNEIIQESVRL